MTMRPANEVSVHEAMAAYADNVRQALRARDADSQLAHHEIHMIHDAFRRSIRYDRIVDLIIADRIK